MDGKRGQANGRVVNEPSRTEAGMTGHDESLGADLSGRPSVCFLFVFFWGARDALSGVRLWPSTVDSVLTFTGCQARSRSMVHAPVP